MHSALKNILMQELVNNAFIILHIMCESPKIIYNKYMVRLEDLDDLIKNFEENSINPTKIAMSISPFGLDHEWISL